MTQAVDNYIRSAKVAIRDTRFFNNIRLAKVCATKLMRRTDVQRIMNDRKSSVVADSPNRQKQTK